MRDWLASQTRSASGLPRPRRELRGLSHIDRASDWLRGDAEAAKPDVGMASAWREAAPFGGRLVYVQADRTGPRKSYPLSASTSTRTTP